MNIRTLLQDNGLSLVKIECEEQNDLVNDLIQEDTWLGIDDIAEEGKFTYLDGSDLTFNNFAPNEPNNSRDNENCVHIRSSGQWNDPRCDYKMRAVYQFAIPIPGHECMEYPTCKSIQIDWLTMEMYKGLDPFEKYEGYRLYSIQDENYDSMLGSIQSIHFFTSANCGNGSKIKIDSTTADLIASGTYIGYESGSKELLKCIQISFHNEDATEGVVLIQGKDKEGSWKYLYRLSIQGARRQFSNILNQDGDKIAYYHDKWMTMYLSSIW
ncbi:hypothetical protein CTEN210_03930 [Chaetoceros tenuissimus]|uniref:C-type lectin domain-containing protein n=1 Tax=Chaetoceros tenuissimus TaxID=426638 RepID=A0AAD3CLV2_9STRA|nr:hypothetical protein CTEN210_03930 [Chaetoceros tenuissimus]